MNGNGVERPITENGIPNNSKQIQSIYIYNNIIYIYIYEYILVCIVDVFAPEEFII